MTRPDSVPSWAMPNILYGNTPGRAAVLGIARMMLEYGGPPDPFERADSAPERWGVAAYRMGARTLASAYPDGPIPHRLILAAGLRALAGRVCALADSGYWMVAEIDGQPVGMGMSIPSALARTDRKRSEGLVMIAPVT